MCRMRALLVWSLLILAGCYGPGLSRRAVGCYDLHPGSLASRLDPAYGLRLPKVIRLDSSFSAAHEGSRQAAPHTDDVTMSWTIESGDWMLVPGDTIVVPSNGPGLHHSLGDSIVLSLSGRPRIAAIQARLAPAGANYHGLAFFRDWLTSQQRSEPVTLWRTPCPDGLRQVPSL